MVCNPADRAEIESGLEAHGFVVRAAETFQPTLRFADFDEFMTLLTGGWLTRSSNRSTFTGSAQK